MGVICKTCQNNELSHGDNEENEDESLKVLGFIDVSS